jgi:proteasome alpha subunit
MQEERESYDQSITIYSPDGRMYQVEYAREAVKKGSISIGMVYKDGIMLMVEKRLSTTLLIPESVEKIFQINDNMGCSTSGLIADARTLVDYAREEIANFKIRYAEEMSVSDLVKRISNIKRIYTQYGGIRPFGVSFLIGGIDDAGMHLYETDPSGAFKKYKAGAIGEKNIDVAAIFDEKYKENMTLKAAVHLAFNAITQALEKNVNKSNFEIVIITKKDGIKRLPIEEVENLKKGIKAPKSK